jgi:hypothetical protein
MKKSSIEPNIETIKKKLKAIISSIPNVVEDEQGKFRKNNRKIWFVVKRNKVIVEPIDYWYNSLTQVEEEEFEVKNKADIYFKFGIRELRLKFEEKKENGEDILYCKMTGAGINIEFKPRWLELLNGVNRMVLTEYKNAKRTRNTKDMIDIFQNLRKITKKAEIRCRLLGYKV